MKGVVPRMETYFSKKNYRKFNRISSTKVLYNNYLEKKTKLFFH